jgi:hypothetical protein
VHNSLILQAYRAMNLPLFGKKDVDLLALVMRGLLKA